MEDQGQSEASRGGSQGRVPGEMTSRRPGEEATFLDRKAACAFEYHRGNSGTVGKLPKGMQLACGRVGGGTGAQGPNS